MDMFTNIMSYHINKHPLEFTIFFLMAVLVILCVIICIWKVQKIWWMREDRRWMQEFEMHNLPRVQNVENALYENTSADAPEIIEH